MAAVRGLDYQPVSEKVDLCYTSSRGKVLDLQKRNAVADGFLKKLPGFSELQWVLSRRRRDAQRRELPSDENR